MHIRDKLKIWSLSWLFLFPTTGVISKTLA